MLELRCYESPGEVALRKKMSMFTEMGEMEIFRKTGLTPVFFARTLIGQRQPNFVYMLVHENLAAREKNWDNFRNSPDWKKLASTPGFADAEILTNITTKFRAPRPTRKSDARRSEAAREALKRSRRIDGHTCMTTPANRHAPRPPIRTHSIPAPRSARPSRSSRRSPASAPAWCSPRPSSAPAS